MRRLLSFLLVVTLSITSFARASEPFAGDTPHPHAGGGASHSGRAPFEKFLYPPELVLHNQIAIGLTDEQLRSVKQLLNETQTRVLDIQADLARAGERLAGILAASRVDEAAVLAAAERAMALESQVKKAHLSLVVRIKNLLSEEQQQTLDGLREKR